MDYRRYQVHWWVPRLGETCLLVIDMQNYFLDLASPITPNIQNLLSLFREKG